MNRIESPWYLFTGLLNPTLMGRIKARSVAEVRYTLLRHANENMKVGHAIYVPSEREVLSFWVPSVFFPPKSLWPSDGPPRRTPKDNKNRAIVPFKEGEVYYKSVRAGGEPAWLPLASRTAATGAKEDLHDYVTRVRLLPPTPEVETSGWRSARIGQFSKKPGDFETEAEFYREYRSWYADWAQAQWDKVSADNPVPRYLHDIDEIVIGSERQPRVMVEAAKSYLHPMTARERRAREVVYRQMTTIFRGPHASPSYPENYSLCPEEPAAEETASTVSIHSKEPVAKEPVAKEPAAEEPKVIREAVSTDTSCYRGHAHLQADFSAYSEATRRAAKVSVQAAEKRIATTHPEQAPRHTPTAHPTREEVARWLFEEPVEVSCVRDFWSAAHRDTPNPALKRFQDRQQAILEAWHDWNSDRVDGRELSVPVGTVFVVSPIGVAVARAHTWEDVKKCSYHSNKGFRLEIVTPDGLKEWSDAHAGPGAVGVLEYSRPGTIYPRHSAVAMIQHGEWGVPDGWVGVSGLGAALVRDWAAGLSIFSNVDVLASARVRDIEG